MKNDLISRSALLENLEHAKKESKSFIESFFIEAITEIISKYPAVDTEPVRHGRWAHLGGDEWCCTQCGDVIHTEGGWEKPTKKYCNECGAKMDGDVNA